MIHPQPKPPPAQLKRADRDAKRDRLDERENAKARKRADGQCEVRTLTRCTRTDRETHHLKGGIGIRNRGNSILAAWKLRVCEKCHREITGRVLVANSKLHDATVVRFWRQRL
jgi:hypothetical protein